MVTTIETVHRIVTKKFELMLTRRVKAYSSFCSQTVSLSRAIGHVTIRLPVVDFLWAVHSDHVSIWHC